MKSMIRGMQNYRQAVSVWKQELPKECASKVFEELKEQTAVLLDKRAEAWFSENKMIHAGAAQKLADQLRSK